MANNSQFPPMQPLRPPAIPPPVPSQNGVSSLSRQFRPVLPAQPVQPYNLAGTQQFQPPSYASMGMPPPTQSQFAQPLPHGPPRPSTAVHSLPPGQAIPVPDFQLNRPVAPLPVPPQQNVQIANSYMPNFVGPRMVLPSSYTLPPSSVGQPQLSADSANLYQTVAQTNISNPQAGQPWPFSGNQTTNAVTPSQQTAVLPMQQSTVPDVQQTAVPTVPQTTEQSRGLSSPETVDQPDSVSKAALEWIEHTSREGKRYYYNRRTQLSTWDKPLELMTAVERADASTDWREITSPDGRKYYYNKVTKQSKWAMPDEVKLAREQMKLKPLRVTTAISETYSWPATADSISGINSSPSSNGGTTVPAGVVPSPIPVEPVVSSPLVLASASSNLAVQSSISIAEREQNSVETATPTAATPNAVVGDGTTVCHPKAVTTPRSDSDIPPSLDTATSIDGNTQQNVENGNKCPEVPETGSIPATEEKNVDAGPLVYDSKQAKNVFKDLLETSNVGSDWNWDQTMRVIINDRRYGALKSLGERKQAFNEYVMEKKRQEAEERRSRLKKAREDFKRMLEEFKELTSSTKWSKAVTIFENDERFKAVERSKDREDLFEDYIEQLIKKERAKVLEEKKRNRMEYIEFLKSCDFIKASSQWRKVQDRLEDDERCSRLEKIDQLEIFQEYIHNLEKEEEEQRKLKMEETRKAERKNRDEFRKMMDEHVRTGLLTARTHWRDYCTKIKDSPAYLAVSSNTAGSTAKELFGDVAEELEKQFLEDKEQIKDAIKMEKITMSSTWTLEDLKSAVSKDQRSPLISDINFKLIFDELIGKAREKEEKEAKRRKRLEDNFHEYLRTSKDITTSSKWDDFKHFVGDRFGEENLFQELFERFIAELKEKAKEREKRKEEKAKKDKDRRERQKRKDKHRREKERDTESRRGKERHSKDGIESERTDSYNKEESKRSTGRDKDRKNLKRNSLEDMSVDENEKERSRHSRRHSSDRKKPKQMEQAWTTETDSESQPTIHKKDDIIVSRWTGGTGDGEHIEREATDSELLTN